MGPDKSQDIAQILNAAWWVRHYQRGGRADFVAVQRAQAIQRLGLVVRDAFSRSDEFEALLGAIVDGLRPNDRPPF